MEYIRLPKEQADELCDVLNKEYPKHRFNTRITEWAGNNIFQVEGFTREGSDINDYISPTENIQGFIRGYIIVKGYKEK